MVFICSLPRKPEVDPLTRGRSKSAPTDALAHEDLGYMALADVTLHSVFHPHSFWLFGVGLTKISETQLAVQGLIGPIHKHSKTFESVLISFAGLHKFYTEAVSLRLS